ncbi:MAG: hypothetical protein M1836_006346 [Candelina mexicana]|nr:MAG: hypothetical protein M1836_006346 [Candelina mexicana]
MDTTSKAPQWPAVLRIALRIFSSAAIVRPLVISQSTYFRSRNMIFSGDEPSRLNFYLYVLSIFLVGIVITSLVSFMSMLIRLFRHKFSASTASEDRFVVASVVLYVAAWIAGIVVFEHFQKPDKANLAWYACHYKRGATSNLADFDMACEEQIRRAIADLKAADY